MINTSNVDTAELIKSIHYLLQCEGGFRSTKKACPTRARAPLLSTYKAEVDKSDPFSGPQKSSPSGRYQSSSWYAPYFVGYDIFRVPGDILGWYNRLKERDYSLSPV